MRPFHPMQDEKKRVENKKLKFHIQKLGETRHQKRESPKKKIWRLIGVIKLSCFPKYFLAWTRRSTWECARQGLSSSSARKKGH